MAYGSTERTFFPFRVDSFTEGMQKPLNRVVFFTRVSIHLKMALIHLKRRQLLCQNCFASILKKGPSVSLTLCCFVVYSTRRFVVCLTLCYFVLVFFSPFSIAITSLGEERANLSALCTFVRFALV